jgi:uncharacterized protein YcbK (DUF882 family)
MKEVQLSKNFKLSEFRCKCCGEVIVDPVLLNGLQELRDLLGKPLIITSGYRCKKHNKDVGGSPNSQHLLGKAADIYAPAFEIHELGEIAKHVEVFYNGGMGLYPKQRFLHVDVRGVMARWVM